MSSGTRLTRAELYALVWEKAVTHVAKSFGLSDVGLRKICVKHDIPTPSNGYWAKLAHGKAVEKTPLPPLRDGTLDCIFFAGRSLHSRTAAVVAAKVSEKPAGEPPVIVPRERPADLLPCLVAAEKALKKAKPDYEGFVSCLGAGLPHVQVGPDSIERALILLDAFLKAGIDQGCRLKESDKGLMVVAEGEPFVFRLYETKDKRTYTPSREDLKRQARYDEDSKRYPTLYTPGRIVYAPWEYYPSGRLALEVTDPSRWRWRGENLVGRWHDRRTRKLDEYLGPAVAALSAAAVLTKQRRADEQEKARLQALEEMRQRKEQARRERDIKRREFLMEMANNYAEYSKLAAFAAMLDMEAVPDGTGPVDRLVRALNTILQQWEGRFGRESLAAQIDRLGLFADDDLL